MIAAVENNQTALVEWLLAHGAETDQMEPIYNETALFKASFKGFAPIVTILISNGKNYFRGAFHVLGQKATWYDDNHEYALIHIFSPLQEKKTVHVPTNFEKLNLAGADVTRTIKNGETCLLWASFKGHKEIVQALISAGDNNLSIIPT